MKNEITMKYRGLTVSTSEKLIKDLKETYNIDFEVEMKSAIDKMVSDIEINKNQ